MKNRAIDGPAPGAPDGAPVTRALKYTGTEPALYEAVGFNVVPGQVVQHLSAAAVEVLLGTGLWQAADIPAGEE